MGEDKEEGEEGMVVGMGEVGSGVVGRELSGQCGMGVGMERVVEVEVEEVQGVSGGQRHGRVIQ